MALHYFLKRAGFTTEEVPLQAKVPIEGVDNGMRQASRVGALERKGAQAHSRRYSNEAYTCAHHDAVKHRLLAYPGTPGTLRV